MITIKRGFDLPIVGALDTMVVPGPLVKQVAVTGFDCLGIKPAMSVAVGDTALKGQLLFTDKKAKE